MPLVGNRYAISNLASGEYVVRFAYGGELADVVVESGLAPDLLLGEIRFSVGDEDEDLGPVPDLLRTSVDIHLIDESGDGIDPGAVGDLVFRDVQAQSAFGLNPARGCIPGSQRVASFDAGPNTDVPALYPAVWAVDFQEPLPAAFYVDAIRSGGRDVLRRGLEVTGGRTAPVEIVLADGAGRVAGVVRDGSGDPVGDARVVLVPVLNGRPELLLGVLPSNTRQRSILTDDRGNYLLENVPPGDYFLLAIDERGRFDPLPYWEDPEFLRSNQQWGKRVQVNADSPAGIDLEAFPFAR